MSGTRPTLHVAAGPDGSGKSTLTRSGRFGGAHIVDPGAIARRTAPGAPKAPPARRFDRSRANLPAAIMRADESRLYDNTNLDDPYREVAVLTRDAYTFAENPPSWVTDTEGRT